MFGKLFNLLVAALMLLGLGWQYRDTDTVRQRRPLIESALSKVGVGLNTVRLYWPLDTVPNPALPGAAVGPVDTVAPDNLVSRMRAKFEDAVRAQRQRDPALPDPTSP